MAYGTNLSKSLTDGTAVTLCRQECAGRVILYDPQDGQHRGPEQDHPHAPVPDQTPARSRLRPDGMRELTPVPQRYHRLETDKKCDCKPDPMSPRRRVEDRERCTRLHTAHAITIKDAAGRVRTTLRSGSSPSLGVARAAPDKT